MRCFIPLVVAGLCLAGCASRSPAPAPPVRATGAATQLHGATPQISASAPATVKPPVQPDADSAKQPGLITIDHAALAPYFEATSSSLQGTFLVQGDDLYYVKDGARVHVLKGTHALNGAPPRALAVGSQGVIVSDGAKLFWFAPTTSQLHEIPGAPPAVSVAARGDTYLIAGNKSVVRWTPDTAPVELSKPDHLYAVSGITLSPDGRYGVVAYDLAIPNGPRATVVWAFDLKSGTILKWPAEQPIFDYGAWLLGWSGPHTIRFMTGVQGFYYGHTWPLPDGDPSERDGSGYRSIHAWMSPDGSWIADRPIPEEVVVQSVQPGAKAIRVYKDLAGLDDARILLNGNVAFRTRSPAVWWEVTREGTVVRWGQADAIY